MKARMGPLVATMIIVLVQMARSEEGEKLEPKVAFLCNKSAMHRGVNGWESDPSTDCLTDKTDILKYCKKMYPNHDITNIVESSTMETIADWPSKSGRKHSHTVRPFRCISGTFQSDALLVPQHCVFDHYHNTDQCQSFDYWNATAISRCRQRGMRCQSFAMLLDCDLDAFNGVEFVCCPYGGEPGDKAAPVHLQGSSEEDEDEDDSDEEDEDVRQPKRKHHGHHGNHHQRAGGKDSSSSDVMDLDHATVYERYLKGLPMPEFKNEHQRYMAARKIMKKNERIKSTKLMKEWQEFRENNMRLKKTDPKAAEKQDKEVAERFQRLFKAYEDEEKAEKRQIQALHQQRVQHDFNVRKRKLMDLYMDALRQNDAALALKYLRAYVRVEEKDRMHTVDHYEHVAATQPQEAARIHPHVVEHLRLSAARINQSVQILARVPDVQRKVQPEIEKFLARYRSVDNSINAIVAQAPPQQPASHQASSSSSSQPASHSQSQDNKSGQDGEEMRPVQPAQSPESEQAEQPEFDSETMENEHSLPQDKAFAANQQAHDLSIQQDMRVQHNVANSMGNIFGIAIGSVAVFVIIVVAIVMLRRRGSASSSARPAVTHGYVEVDPAASPEERHVANMQMNGYENPTYRYFEMQPQ